MNVSNESSVERLPLKQTSKILEPANLKFSKIQYGEEICCMFLIITVFVGLCTMAFLLAPSGTIDPLSYSLGINYDHQVAMKTKEHGIEFYVKSSYEFDQKFPVGTRARAEMEGYIIKDYLLTVRGHCLYESFWHIQRRDFPTPFCDLSDKFNDVIP